MPLATPLVPLAGDQVNMSMLGSRTPAPAPATPTGATGGWNQQLSQTRSQLAANPLADAQARMAMGQRLSGPSTNGLI